MATKRFTAHEFTRINLSEHNLGKQAKDFQPNVRQSHPKLHILYIFRFYFTYALIYLAGYVREFVHWFLPANSTYLPVDTEKNIRAGIQSVVDGHAGFYLRNVFLPVNACFHTPLTGSPSVKFEIRERKRNHIFEPLFELTGKTRKALNFGSYNYLGFAQNDGPCVEASKVTVEKYGIGMGSSRSEMGSLQLHRDLEKLVAEFLGKEDAATFGMGFITNAGNIPAILGKGCLLISDELNHASIVLGAKLGTANIRTFKHNDMYDLEKKLKKAIIEGQPKTRRPWKKIIVIVEGIYSMEGTISYIPSLIALKQKYKFYIWLDEAHSIGAMGPTGRGVVEYWGSDANEIDIMMGTFSKSFGAHGGYIASTKAVVSHIRRQTHTNYASAMTPGVAMQIYSSLRIIMGRDDRYPNDGQRRIRRLAENTRYFRSELYKRGLVVYGADDSPIVPLIIFTPNQLDIISRTFMHIGIGIVTVGYPATPLLECRLRFCLSAAHTRDMLDYCLHTIDDVSEMFGLAFLKNRPIPPIPFPTPHEQFKNFIT
ncbi:Serine palmitoyltransferase 2-like [Oopsacas minuta]|uniref:serine C-palmitoyltransferase n=1 Tax=Oopsacas minuta TaxID=111878 RepID=A0AAV7K8N6_9METZ|nr:Serine palmitoyltransferase 2-like [Oopsacas minuta]